MKIKRSKFYKELYVSENVTYENDMNHFLLCGDINLSYYFENRVVGSNSISSIKLIEFYSENDLKKYLLKINKSNLQDFCIEEKYFAVLEL